MKIKTLEKMNMLTSLLLAGLGGLVLGGTAVFVITKDKSEPIEQPSPVVVVQDPVAGGQQDVIKQVTDPDLVAVSCSKEHIDQHGDLLCREMFCRLQQRGIDAKTSSTECEEISNIANTKVILESCVQKVKVDGEELETSTLNEECVDLFSKRK